ncbi:hypothetical protein FLA_0435 [Filimonas lacunae]|nr:hypothetical protein FLA_0435 [Filimonas lacunae]
MKLLLAGFVTSDDEKFLRNSLKNYTIRSLADKTKKPLEITVKSNLLFAAPVQTTFQLEHVTGLSSLQVKNIHCKQGSRLKNIPVQDFRKITIYNIGDEFRLGLYDSPSHNVKHQQVHLIADKLLYAGYIKQKDFPGFTRHLDNLLDIAKSKNQESSTFNLSLETNVKNEPPITSDIELRYYKEKDQLFFRKISYTNRIETIELASPLNKRLPSIKMVAEALQPLKPGHDHSASVVTNLHPEKKKAGKYNKKQ